MLSLILLILGIGAILSESLMLFLWIGARLQYRQEKISSYTPKACIIIPCKGTHDSFQENIKACLRQEIMQTMERLLD